MNTSPFNRLRDFCIALQSPILIREMRVMLRGLKFFISLFILLMVLAAVLFVAALGAAASRGGTDTAALGHILYWAFAFALSIVVVFLVPAFTCTAITDEREGRTLEMLLTTTIRPWAVIWGKLLSSLLVIMLFLCASLPMVTICFLFGGISPWDLAVLYIAVFVGTVVVSSVSLAVSAHCKESKSAVVVSYALTMLIVLLVSLVVGVIGASLGSREGLTLAIMLSELKFSQQILAIGVPVFVAAAMVAVHFAAAANCLKPKTVNRSTSVRIFWCCFCTGSVLLFWVTMQAWPQTAPVAVGTVSDATFWIILSGTAITWFSGIFFGSEEALQPVGVVENTQRLTGFNWPLRIFMPGPITGIAFVSVFSVVSLYWLGRVLTQAGLADQDAAVAGILAGLFAAVVVSISAVFSSLKMSRTKVVLASSVVVLCINMLPIAIQFILVEALGQHWGGMQGFRFLFENMSPLTLIVGLLSTDNPGQFSPVLVAALYLFITLLLLALARHRVAASSRERYTQLQESESDTRINTTEK
jgi:ABC-2 type transport system permease protein